MARILFFDDEAAELWGMRARLEARGHDVVEAHNPAQARDSLDQGVFDLMILDVMMPLTATPESPDSGRRAGLMFYERLREEAPDRVPVTLVFTKVDDEAIRQRVEELGLEVLFKPVLPSELARKVESLLAGKRTG